MDDDNVGYGWRWLERDEIWRCGEAAYEGRKGERRERREKKKRKKMGSEEWGLPMKKRKIGEKAGKKKESNKKYNKK